MNESAGKLITDSAGPPIRLAWAFGSISVGIKNNLLGVWILFYYNQVLGLDAYLVSSADQVLMQKLSTEEITVLRRALNALSQP